MERKSDLIGEYNGVQNQLADMSDAAAAQGITLLPVTPDWGGNLTTNRIQSLDERAAQIKNALSENEDAARRAGLAPNALP
jgi:aryl-alcohol dehydrogenase-like predicted oxidoreductase